MTVSSMTRNARDPGLPDEQHSAAAVPEVVDSKWAKIFGRSTEQKETVAAQEKVRLDSHRHPDDRMQPPERMLELELGSAPCRECAASVLQTAEQKAASSIFSKAKLTEATGLLPKKHTDLSLFKENVRHSARSNRLRGAGAGTLKRRCSPVYSSCMSSIWFAPWGAAGARWPGTVTPPSTELG